MKHHCRLFAATLLLVQAFLLAWGAARHSPVIDEPAHLAAGISNWQLAGFELFKVNPPLVRMIAAIPAMAAGAKTDYGRYSHGVGVRAEFAVMDDFVRANGERVIWLVTIARWGLIPLVLLGGYVGYRWARELYGDKAGMVALALWCLSPDVLAYGQLINADAGAAALGVTAAHFFWKWLREPAWDRAVVAGVTLGLAELTKTTWVVLFALWPVLWFVVRCLWPAGSLKSEVQSPKSGKGSGFRVQGSGTGMENPKSRCCCYELAQLAVVLGLGVFCINAGYEFEGSSTKLRNYVFLSGPLTRVADGQQAGYAGNRFAESWLGKLPVPLPRSYVEGIDVQWHDIELGKPSYLCGQWKERGWWYWYLYALAVKVPLGTWGLFLLAVGVRLARCSPKSKIRPKPEEKAEGERQKAESAIGKTQDISLETFPPNPKPKFQNPNSDRPHPGPRYPLAGAEGEGERSGTESVPYRTTWRDELVLLAPAATVLVLVSSQTGFSRYIRYVLPILPFVYIWVSSVACGFGSLARNATQGVPYRCGRASAVLTAILLAWSVGSSLWYAPHWMSYFNELAGGPMGGPAHLIDAQVDWGQDLRYLKKWLDAHPEARPLRVVYFGMISPTLGRIVFTLPPKGIVVSADRNELAGVPQGLEPGWYAISVNYLYGYHDYCYGPDGSREWVPRPYYSYFRRFQPTATAGYSIYIYQLSAEDIENVRRKTEG